MSEITESAILNEKLIINELSSGLKCYIIPKKGYVMKQAMVCSKYGSLDNEFVLDGKKHVMPEGVAHFLEHKLFEEESGGNVFDKFITLGADCNAFTNFMSTAYYFSCAGRFDENLKLLLDFTQNPYFTQDNVEKEKGIISQEISMYDDNPRWIAYFNMMKAMFSVNPIKGNIAGTSQSIKEINKEMLYDCYNAFYDPSNMALVVCGDVDETEIVEIAESACKKSRKPCIERIYGEEPKEISQKYIERKMSVALPLFNIGFKENDFSTEYAKKNAAAKVLLDIAAGESSLLYGRLYDEGLINADFGTDYIGSPYYGASVLEGCSKEPKRVHAALAEEISRLKKEDIPDSVFDRMKKKHIGRFIKGFNSIDAIACAQTDCFTKDTDIIKIFDGYCNLHKDDIMKRLDEHFNDEFSVLSVINSD